jgi:PilZ domain
LNADCTIWEKEELMQNGSEMRREPRFVFNQPVFVSIQGSSSGIGGIFDISEHGLSFTFRRPLDPGDIVIVEYGGCLVQGQVRHCRVRGYAQQQFLVGVAVTQVVEGEETWRRLIQQCCGEA